MKLLANIIKNKKFYNVTLFPPEHVQDMENYSALDTFINIFGKRCNK